MPDHFKFRQSVGSDARRWYRRETGATPVGGSFCPVAQQLERPALTREVDGANPSGAAIFGSQSGRACRRRLEAGRSCNRSLWSMSTDFRFGSQALQRCSGLTLRRPCGQRSASLEEGARAPRILKPRSTGQHRGDSPIPTWKLNRTSAPGPPRKRIVLLRRMGSMTSGFRHSHAGLAEQPCTRPVNEIRPGQHR